MPWQLIYTSAPRGLLSGQSGFCTVARSADLREALMQRLEQISSYHYLRVAEAATANRNPTLSAFRILDLRGTKYYVLTRIQPAGLDFTARTNHIAHHLIFQGNELSQLPSPAAILLHWPGWLSCWQGEPRLLEDPLLDSFVSAARPCLPAQTWQRITGDAGKAAGLLESECIRGCYLLCPPGSEQQVLEMFCETLQLLNLTGQYALRPWRHPFTTFLQGEDNAADFQWRACQEGTPATQRGVTLMPLRSVRAPANSLAKVAREGQKLSPPPTSVPPSPLRRTLPVQPSPAEPPETPSARPEPWREPVSPRKKAGILDINLALDSAGLARIGVFVGVLLVLLAMRFWLFKKHAPPAVPVVVVSQPAIPAAHQTRQTAPESPASPTVRDTTQLAWLSADEPTYIIPLSNPAAFELPITHLSRFQNLLHKFDQLETRPGDIQMSATIDQWDFRSGAPLTVNTWRAQTPLSAHSDSGLSCSFDYQNWKSDPQAPLLVRTSLTTPPAALAIRFGFSRPDAGEPFGLLIVNESNPPVPLRLGLNWLRGDEDSLMATIQPPLGERLLGNFLPMGDAHWRLLPYIPDAKGGQSHSLYKGWPTNDVPAPGGELDFAQVKVNLAAHEQSLKDRSASLAKKIALQTRLARFDLPLGADLHLATEKMASFSDYAPNPAPDDFLQYLNALKKRTRLASWPHFNEDDDETDLAVKFQQLHDFWIAKVPEAREKLTAGNTNYFAAVWQSLKSIDKIRLEKNRVDDTMGKLQGRMKLVPVSLDKVAYVGLFLVDGSKPEVEVIRFQGP
jgi:hypothetical protein